MVEEYYQETLEKWQAIAAGQRSNTGVTCGFCRFATRWAFDYCRCLSCPVRVVWPGKDCDSLPEIIEAHEARSLTENELMEAAGKVVALLEENKEALIKAMREIKRSEEDS